MGCHYNLRGQKRKRENSSQSYAAANPPKDPKLDEAQLSIDVLCRAGRLLYHRYVVKKKLGEGSFGKALQLYDRTSKKLFAMKVIKDASQESKKEAESEIRVLTKIRTMDTEKISRIILLQDHFKVGSHVCMVFELMQMTLFEFIKNPKNRQKLFPVTIVKKIGFQVLQALKFLQKAKMVHGDLKPENIMIKNLCTFEIKVIDLGGSFIIGKQRWAYFGTRYYRAPETILCGDCDFCVDMWSLGCILYELHTRVLLFNAKNQFQLLQKIIEVVGSLPAQVIRQGKNKHIFYDEPKKFSRYKLKPTSHMCHKPGSLTLFKLLNATRKKKFSGWKTCHGNIRAFVLILRKMLTYDKCRRISVEDAKNHPFFKSVKTDLENGGVMVPHSS